jgi:hypothetical protein
MKKVIVAIAMVTASMTALPSAHAVSQISGGPFTNLNPAGDTVHFGFASYPTGKGFYFFEAVQPATGQRPSIMVGTADTTWVSASPGATSPTGDIAVKVVGAFPGADCSKVQCGVFVRLDHTAPMDTSEDQFFPISFRAGTAAPVLPSDVITATINGKPLSGMKPGTLVYRTPVTVNVTTKSGVTATIVSSTPDCSVAGNVIQALKGSGACDFAISSAGNSSYAAVTSHFPFMLAQAKQKVAIKVKKVKVKGTLALPAQTNMGENITYVSTTNRCTVAGTTLTGVKTGACTLIASAPASANYTALKEKLVLNVNK